MKNIAEPVRVYGVLTGPTSPAPAAASRAVKAATRRWLWPAVAAALVVAIAGGAAWWRPWAPSPAPPAAQVASARRSKPAIRRRSRAGRLRASVARRLRTLRKTVARRAPVRQSFRRQGAGLSRRRHHRGSHDRAGAHPRPVRDLAQRRLHLQGQGGPAGRHRQGARRPLPARRLDPPGRRRHPHQRPAHRRREQRPHVGGALRRRLEPRCSSCRTRWSGRSPTALKLRLVESQRAAQIAGGTSNPAAYDAWLRGLELENRGTPEDIAKAATSYQQAVALDPDYGRAWASLAWLLLERPRPRAGTGVGPHLARDPAQTGRSLAGGRKAPLSNLLSDTGGAPRSAAEIGRGDRGAGEGHRARFEQRLELRD